MKVLVTRAQPANARTCEALTAIGHEPISLPIFELRDTDIAIPQEIFQGYIFTSSNAAQILHGRDNLNLNLSLPAYCVGQKTAKEVARLGFKNIEIANGNAQALADFIVSKKLAPKTSLLYFTTKDRSFEIADHLATHEIKVHNLELYQMNPIQIEQKRFMAAISKAVNSAILVYSKRSGEHLAHLLKASQIDISALKISTIAISNQAASALENFPWEKLHVAPIANEHSMFHILDE